MYLYKSFILLIIGIIFFASCEKEASDGPTDSLYIKSAGIDEAKVLCIDGRERYYFPNDILFIIPVLKSTPEILNNSMLKIEDFKILSNNQVNFTVSEIGSEMIVVPAYKLPFCDSDYDFQSESGVKKFNGILKSGDFVFAVKVTDEKINIKILDLKTNYLTTTIASYSNNALIFKVGAEIWQLWLSKISNRGNIFQMFVEGKGYICYSLYLAKN